MEPEGSLPHSQASATCLYPGPGQANPVHIPTSHLLEIHPNIIHPPTPRSLQWALSLRFPHQDPIHPPLLSHTRHMPSPSHSSRFYHPHNIGWGVQMKHAERVTEINTLWNVASCWLYSPSIFVAVAVPSNTPVSRRCSPEAHPTFPLTLSSSSVSILYFFYNMLFPFWFRSSFSLQFHYLMGFCVVSNYDATNMLAKRSRPSPALTPTFRSLT